MRSGDHIWKANERRILRRLFDKDVMRSATEAAAFQCSSQVGFVNEFAAGRIHDARALLHLLNRNRVDHISRGGTQRGMQRNEIALGV